MAAHALTFPPNVLWLNIPCPTCEHETLIEFVRDPAGQIVGARIHDSKPETLPPGALELMRMQRATDRVTFLTGWSDAERVP